MVAEEEDLMVEMVVMAEVVEVEREVEVKVKVERFVII